jgi:hypothetical protein
MSPPSLKLKYPWSLLIGWPMITCIGRMITELEWMPEIVGKIHKPGELSLENLPADFEKNETLARSFE